MFDRLKAQLSEFIKRLEADSPEIALVELPRLNQFLQGLGDSLQSDERLLEKVPLFLDYLNAQDAHLTACGLDLQARLASLSEEREQLEQSLNDVRQELQGLCSDNKFLSEKVLQQEGRQRLHAMKDGMFSKQREAELSLAQRHLHTVYHLNKRFVETPGTFFDESQKSSFYSELLNLVEQRFMFESERLKYQAQLDDLELRFQSLVSDPQGESGHERIQRASGIRNEMAEVQRQLAICSDRIEIIGSQEAQLEENLQRMTTEEKEELRAFEARLNARDRTIEQMSVELEGLRSLVSLQQFGSDLDKPKPFSYQNTSTSHGRSSSLLEQSSHHVVNLQPIKLEKRASPKQSFRSIYGGAE